MDESMNDRGNITVVRAVISVLKQMNGTKGKDELVRGPYRNPNDFE